MKINYNNLCLGSARQTENVGEDLRLEVNWYEGSLSDLSQRIGVSWSCICNYVVHLVHVLYSASVMIDVSLVYV